MRALRGAARGDRPAPSATAACSAGQSRTRPAPRRSRRRLPAESFRTLGFRKRPPRAARRSSQVPAQRSPPTLRPSAATDGPMPAAEWPATRCRPGSRHSAQAAERPQASEPHRTPRRHRARFCSPRPLAPSSTAATQPPPRTLRLPRPSPIAASVDRSEKPKTGGGTTRQAASRTPDRSCKARLRSTTEGTTGTWQTPPPPSTAQTDCPADATTRSPPPRCKAA